MVSPKLAAAMRAIRRSWWLVLLPALVGAVVAGIAVASGPQMYSGTAVIDIETTAFTRLPTLTGPERVLRELQSAEYYEQVAQTAGSVDTAAVQQGLNSYTVGQPITELRVSFTTSDQELAEPVARAAGEVALDIAHAFNEVERERNQRIVDGVDEARKVLQTVPSGTPTEQASAAMQEFGLVVNEANADYTLEVVDSAYALRDAVAVTEAAGERTALESAVGGAVLGLALGVVLALLRDRRRAEA